MHEFADFDDRLERVDGPFIPAVSAAALYGRGVFTTIIIDGGKPRLWDKHRRRLSENALDLGIPLASELAGRAERALDDVIKANGVTDGRARITLFDTSPGSTWADGGEQTTSILILTGDLRPVPQPFRLTLSPHAVDSTSPLAGVKSCNYLEHLIANEEAAARGFNEAVRLNERGEVTSACMANIFWSDGKRLFTPSLNTGCLAGTTREFVLENLECEEAAAGLESLADADAIFLTSAGLGVVRVAEFEGKELSGEGHPILELLAG